MYFKPTLVHSAAVKRKLQGENTVSVWKIDVTLVQLENHLYDTEFPENNLTY